LLLFAATMSSSSSLSLSDETASPESVSKTSSCSIYILFHKIHVIMMRRKLYYVERNSFPLVPDGVKKIHRSVTVFETSNSALFKIPPPPKTPTTSTLSHQQIINTRVKYYLFQHIFSTPSGSYSDATISELRRP
jgi:hypothetical protein